MLDDNVSYTHPPLPQTRESTNGFYIEVNGNMHKYHSLFHECHIRFVELVQQLSTVEALSRNATQMIRIEHTHLGIEPRC